MPTGPATRPNTQRPLPASSHDRILEAAKRSFAGRGYENTSTAAIARLAGTSESQLMKHFGSKEGLLEAIFDSAWAAINREAARAVAESRSPAEKLGALVDLIMTALERDPELKTLLLLEGRRIRKEGRMVMLTQGFREFVRRLDGVLEEMRKAGLLRGDIHLEGLRSALMGAFEGLLRDQLLGQRLGYPAGYNAKDVRVVFGTLLAALAPAGGRRRR